MISAGVMLSAIVDRDAVNNDEMLRDRAAAVLRGIQLRAIAHGVKGVVARPVYWKAGCLGLQL